jgi:hypothetical protein
MPELDINTSANEVVALLEQGHGRDAATRLETLRQNQAPVVQEALDRYVAVRAHEQLGALHRPGAIAATDAAAVAPMLERLQAAGHAPRFPEETETSGLSQTQQYDVYASIVETRGNADARQALETRDRVVLGLRNEDRTTHGTAISGTTNERGTGIYNDRIVVMWKDSEGSRHSREFNSATTEPTAQYDAHAKTTPRSQGFEQVTTRVKTEGEDVNRDGVRDLGRLAEGTTEMGRTTHPRHGYPDEFALRPTTAAVASGQRRVERDSNGDGWFDSRDTQGVQDLNDTFKIHRGSNRNTDSAGCQTIGGGEYDDFVTTVRGTPGQNRWQYVLTSVALPQLQLNERSQDRQTPQSAQPQADPRAPGHPDHALQQQISRGLHALGGRYAEHADAYSLALLYDAKANGMTRVDQIVTSNATGTQAEGSRLFLVQGQGNDPAALRVAADAATVAATPVDTSLQRLQQQREQTEAATMAAPVQQHVQTPAMGGR